MSATRRTGHPNRVVLTRRSGVTLLELLVTLVVLGVLASMVGLSWLDDGWTTRSDREPSTADAAVSAARREAVATGRSVTVAVDSGPRERMVTALPDGRLLGAESLGFDPLSGQRTDAGPAYEAPTDAWER